VAVVSTADGRGRGVVAVSDFRNGKKQGVGGAQCCAPRRQTYERTDAAHQDVDRP